MMVAGDKMQYNGRWYKWPQHIGGGTQRTDGAGADLEELPGMDTAAARLAVRLNTKL